MVQNFIHDKWGTIIELSNPDEFFNWPAEYWRTMIYERKLIVFKRMNFSKLSYAKFCSTFGRMWQTLEYRGSKERAEIVKDGDIVYAISPMSNLSAPRIGQKEMPWHADIPNNDHPFPMRTIWMYKNPDPESGLTSWLNIEDGFDILPDDLKSRAEKIKIIQQSWWMPGTRIKEFDFIKTHSVTGRKSLRLNYYCEPDKNIHDGWIKNAVVDGVTFEPREVLTPYYDFLTTKKELLYTHKWDTFDIIVYDNWPFVHNRTHLNFDNKLERLLYRTNIDHILPQ